jgi:ParB family transcriptional regulator, chromosome partitioning protein
VENEPLRENDQIVEVMLDDIRVLNPRLRGRLQHRAIVASVSAVGLKRPVTVSRRPDADANPHFDLVCGQGRIEAVRLLGHKSIPARVIKQSETSCLEMSLVENVARRKHDPMELLRDVKSLIDSGYTTEEMAEKIGLTPGYLRSLILLLEHGEERLLNAVERGTVPIGLAVSIARSEEAEVQRALADAYAEGTLKGRQLSQVRRLIQQRVKHHAVPKPGKRGESEAAVTPEQLRKIYIKDSEAHQLLTKKADLVHTRVTIIENALRTLLQDDIFVALLGQEGLSSVPKVLDQRIRGEHR